MEQNIIRFIQDQIGYEFSNPSLLQQAFTRRSYSAENGGENNEVLEFIGDKVLDLIVVKLLTEQYGTCDNTFHSDRSEAELTELKKLLVQKNTLADRIAELAIAPYLRMGKGDKLQNIGEENSVMEDLFEAILGAIAIDSNWDMDKMQGAVETMLAPEIILSSNEEDDYYSMIQEWCAVKENRIPLFHFEERSYTSKFYDLWEGISQSLSPNDLINFTSHLESNRLTAHNIRFHCYMKVSNDLPLFRGFGRTHIEARRNVCKLAYDYLCKKGLWLSIRDEIEDPSKDAAINQLEILARRGYFSIPTYDFEQTYDQNGNPVWKSICHIAEKKKTFSAISSSKKDAKKTAAYQMLQFVLGE